MNEAPARDAAATVGRMFGASPERVAELAKWIRDQMSCPACLALALEELLGELDRFPSPKVVMVAYRRAMDSGAHATHVNLPSRAVEVGRLEAFWRKDAARICAQAAGDDLVGAFIAAEMWASGVVEPTAEAVRADLDDAPVWTRIREGSPTQAQVEEMFWAARQAATMPLIDLPEAEWVDRCDRIGNALAWSA